MRMVPIFDPDLIILDIMMPGLDGIEACARIREYSSAPILFLTAKTLEDDKAQAYGAGGDDYLGKPIDGAEFERMLAKYIAPEKVTYSEKKADAPIKKTSESEEDSALIDISLGLRYCGDSEEMYREIVGVYCEMHDEMQGDLEKALSENDWKNYTVNIHSLKSNSLNIGASGLSKMCLELEKAGKAITAGEEPEANAEKIRTMHPEIMRIYATVVEEAAKQLSK